MTNKTKLSKSFLSRRRNTIVALLVIFTVLIAGYFALRGVLVGEVAETTPPAEVELLPGEGVYGSSTLVYPRVERKDIKTVKIHNPANRVYGDVYVDWGIGFAYDDEAKDYYGFLLTYDYAELDDSQLAYFAVGAGYPTISARVEENCSDFSPYGLAFASDEEATYILVEKRDGTTHKLYFGKKNLGGSSYYVRSGDTYVDDAGNTVERNTVYLLSANTTAYADATLLAKPTEMLTTRVTYPIASKFSSFILQEADGDLNISFLPVDSIKNVESVFGGSSVYYTVSPKGYFSSSEFETRIKRFEDFSGVETLEYATTLFEDVDEETGEPYSFYVFEEEVLQKYGLDRDHVKFLMMYTAATEGSEEHVVSEAYFSDLRPDGYYYAYSLSFNTIVRIDPTQVDFLTWDMLQFVDAYALRMSIGYCDTIRFKGLLNGKSFTESFSSTVNEEYRVTGAYADNAGTEVSLSLYRILFQEIYNTMLRGDIPADLDTEALLENEPYLEIEVKTRDVTVYATDDFGMPTTKVEGVIKSARRILRFYRYSNGRAMLTVETIDANGKSSGESGRFYVLTSRLDKLIGDADKLVRGESFSFYDKE